VLQDVTVAFICMNLPYTMDIFQASSAVLQFQPRNVLPYHYRNSNVTEFKEIVESGNSNINVILGKWYPTDL